MMSGWPLGREARNPLIKNSVCCWNIFTIILGKKPFWNTKYFSSFKFMENSYLLQDKPTNKSHGYKWLLCCKRNEQGLDTHTHWDIHTHVANWTRLLLPICVGRKIGYESKSKTLKKSFCLLLTKQPKTPKLLKFRITLESQKILWSQQEPG